MSKNLNVIKLRDDEVTYLNKIIDDIDISLSYQKKEEYILLSKKIFESIFEFNSSIREKSDIGKFILEEIENNEDRSKLSCRNLAESYTNKTGKIIHKSQVNNIMRKKLGLHYLKTSIKTSKIMIKKNKLYSFCFIKVLVRAIKLGYKILFEDESSILVSNNNYKCWRFPDEKIFFGKGVKKRKNLILLVSEDNIIHYKINDKSTNEDSFLKFMEEAVKKIEEKNIKNYIIVMDNLSVHKTRKLIEFRVL